MPDSDDRIALKRNLRFLRDSLEDARAQPENRPALLVEAEECVPSIRRGLKADETWWAQAALIADQIASRDWRDWWKGLAKKTERELLSDIDAALRSLALLDAMVS